MSKKIGELLMERGLLTKAQLQTALRTQEFFGGHLGSIFIELGFLDEPALAEALVQGTGAQYAPPEYLEGIPPEVYQKIPASLAEKHKVVPLRVEHGRLHLAMLHPKDKRAASQIASSTGLAVVPYIAPEFRMFEALERYYRIKPKRSRSISVETPTEEVDLATLNMPRSPASKQAVVLAKDGVEVGLDGLPLDAEFSMDEAYSRPPRRRQKTEQFLGQLPQDVSEWRNADPSPEAPAAPAQPVMPAPEPAAQAGADVNPLEHNARRLLQAENRDQIGEILLQVTERFFQRRLLFIVQRDRIVGWDGSGSGVSRQQVKKALLPMNSLSLFTAVKVGSKPMIGPVADVPANRRLFHDLNMEIPAEVVLLPIRIKERVVAILYGDNAGRPVGALDVGLLRRFTLQAAVALEILILRSKLLSF
jgi:hypothetical protein